MFKVGQVLGTGAIRTLLVAVLYIALAVVYTLPAVWHFRDGTLTYQGGGDLRQFLWNLWYFKYALVDLKTNPFLCDIIFYPEGAATALAPFHALYGLASVPLQMIGVALFQVYTLFALWTYAASGFFTFLLIRYLGRARMVAFLGGLIYAFSAYRLGHVLFGQLNLSATEWMPLYALCLLKLLDRPSVGRGLLLGLAFLAQLYTCYYYAVFLIVLSLVVVLVKLGWQRRLFRGSVWLSPAVLTLSLLTLVSGLALTFVPAIHAWRFSPRDLSLGGWCLLALWFLIFWRPASLFSLLRSIAAPMAAAIGCVVVGFGPALLAIFSKPFQGELSARLSSEFYMSLNLLSVFAPLSDGLVWQRIVKPFFLRPEGTGIEAFNYLGVVLTVLLALSFFQVRRPRCDRSAQLRLWLTCCAVFFVLMLGDVLTFGPNGDFFLLKSDSVFMLPLWPIFKRVPVFSAVRVCSRFGAVVMLCAAVPASFAAEAIILRLRKGINRALLGVLLCAVCFVDLLPANVPIFKMHIPEIYKLIGQINEDFTLLELPAGFVAGPGILGVPDFAPMAHQTVHRKRLVGHVTGKIPRAVLLRRWTDPVMGTFLRAAQQGSGGPEAAARAPISHDRLLLDALWAPEFIRRYDVRVVVLRKTPIAMQSLDATDAYIRIILGGARFYSSDEANAYLIPADKARFIPPDQLLADHKNLITELSYKYRLDAPSGQYRVTIEGRLAKPVSDIRGVKLMFESIRVPVDFSVVPQADGTSRFVGAFSLRPSSVGAWGLVSLNFAEVISVGEAESYITMDSEAKPFLTLSVQTDAGTIPHFFMFDLSAGGAGKGEVRFRPA